MVTIHFKMSSVGKVELPLATKTTWEKILEKCTVSHAVETEGIIAVVNGKVLSADDLVADGDVINVFPAISGG